MEKIRVSFFITEPHKTLTDRLEYIEYFGNIVAFMPFVEDYNFPKSSARVIVLGDNKKLYNLRLEMLTVIE